MQIITFKKYPKLRVFPYAKYRFPLYYLTYSVNTFVEYNLQMITETKSIQNISSSSHRKQSYSLYFSYIYDFIFYPFLHPIRKKITNIILNLKKQSVIDLCCGTGNQLKYLKNAGINTIKGIDICENMIKKTEKNGVYTFCSVQNATKTNLLTASYDIAILSFILHETEHKTAKQILQEAKRLIKPNGYIIITDYRFNTNFSFIGRAGAYVIEFLIGGQHFKNYKYFIKYNLLNNLTKDMKLVAEHKHILRAVSVLVLIMK